MQYSEIKIIFRSWKALQGSILDGSTDKCELRYLAQFSSQFSLQFYVFNQDIIPIVNLSLLQWIYYFFSELHHVFNF